MSLTTDMVAMVNGLLDGETITYTPSGGTPRSIPASVRREEPLEEGIGGGGAPVRRYQVTVANDATQGVSAPAIGKDTMSLKVHVADANPATFRLTRILFEDPGAYVLEVTQ